MTRNGNITAIISRAMMSTRRSRANGSMLPHPLSSLIDVAVLGRIGCQNDLNCWPLFSPVNRFYYEHNSP